MYKNALKVALAATGIAVVLVACGGGDDDQAGGVAAFQVQPASMSLTYGSGDGCAGPAAPGTVRLGDFTVIGGTAPYQIFSSDVNGIIPNTSTLSNPNTQFSVDIIGCYTGAVITIMDAKKRAITAVVNAASS